MSQYGNLTNSYCLKCSAAGGLVLLTTSEASISLVAFTLNVVFISVGEHISFSSFIYLHIKVIQFTYTYLFTVNDYAPAIKAITADPNPTTAQTYTAKITFLTEEPLRRKQQ